MKENVRQVISCCFFYEAIGFRRCCVFGVFCLECVPKVLLISLSHQNGCLDVSSTPGISPRSVFLMHFLIWKNLLLRKDPCQAKCKVISISVLV